SPRKRRKHARHVPVRFLRDPDDALEAIARAKALGRAVAYIRNSVDDAIEAHSALQARGVDARLFHARMALIDRFAMESRVLDVFGKKSTADKRAGQVLIATQVIEQSLDLDFD